MTERSKITLDIVMKRLSDIETRLKRIEREETIDEQTDEKDWEEAPKVNKDGIPLGILLIGTTEDAACTAVVGDDDGRYYVNGVPYESLSAAAAAAGAPERKSGWRFWKTMEGDRLRDVYRRK